MNKRWYCSRWMKGILIALEHIALIMALIGGVFLVDQYCQGNSFADVRSKMFIKTSGFSEQVLDSLSNIFDGLNARQSLQEENSDGSERIIDLQEAREGKISYKNTSGLAYTVADLKAWAQNSHAEDDFYNGSDSIVVCRTVNSDYQYYYYSDFIRQYNDGNLQIQWDSSVSQSGKDEVLAALKNCEYYDYPWQIKEIQGKKGDTLYTSIWNLTGYHLNERYKPVGAASILEVANENENWNGQLDSAISILYNELENLRNTMNSQSSLDQYAQGNTNITYLIADADTKKVYTNKKDYDNYNNLKVSLSEIESQDAYTIIRPRLSDCDSNMDIDLQRWQEIVKAMNPCGDDFICAVSVDGKFPVADTLATQNENFEKYNHLLIPALVVLIVGCVIFLLILIWLTAVAGRIPTDRNMHLCRFDRWFTEIAACVVFLLWAMVISLPLAGGWELIGSTTSVVDAHGDVVSTITASVFTNPWLTILLLAAGGGFTAAMFLIGWLSLVRRIKAGILWKNSLVRWFLLKLRGLWRRIRSFVTENIRGVPSVPRLVITVAIFFLFQLILGEMVNESDIALLILLAVDGYALWYLIKKAAGRQQLISGLQRITLGELDYKIPLDKLTGEQREIAEAINNIGAGLDAAVENSLKSERMKTELITNVSHDIKTPLTSIINYIDLLKRENFTDPKIVGYLQVLESKAQRLKVLTEDVVEASKVSTGNISFEMTNLNLVELLHQVCGEFQERFEQQHLTMVSDMPSEPLVICADGRRLYRVLENIFGNAAKYSMEYSRVYVDLTEAEGMAVLQVKNISAQPLNISADELTERFIRGDVARSTEGSGLGLSIARSLTTLQGGDFQLYLDGDLFKVVISFARSDDFRVSER